jgi:dienelactone hydrolase
MIKTFFALLLSSVTFAQIPSLRQGAFFTPEQGKTELQSIAGQYQNQNEWKSRAEIIKKGIITGAGLTSIKAGKKIIATTHSKKTLDGYTVENVFFESLPGIFITGNLYKPFNLQKKNPAVLAPHGHGNDPRFGEATQLRCATMARMGAIVFAWDMIGYGDMQQCDHKISQAFKLQTINSIRVLDFITQMPKVNKNKIVISGESGGGTQTFMLTAIDERINLSIPVVMVSSHFFGGCVCESGMPVHVSPDHATNNVEIATCAAPRPMLLISDGDDWTQFTPTVEFPHIRRIYSFFGKENNIENVHLANEKHDYGPSKRKAAYDFLAKHFGLNIELADETKVNILDKIQLSVYNSDFPLPENAITGNDKILEALNNIK